MIRPARPGDRDALLVLWEGFDRFHASLSDYYFRTPAEEEVLARHTRYMEREDSLYLVHDSDGPLSGFICGQWRRTPQVCLLKERLILELHAVFVAGENRSDGICRALIEKAADLARRKGTDDVEVLIWNFNDRIQKIVREAGFRRISGKYGLPLK